MTPAPFEFMDCAVTVVSLGRSAQNLRELRDHLAGVPAQSIDQHFYGSLLRPEFDHPEYRNDFARWAERQLHDSILAERLSAVDPFDHPDLESVRRRVIDVVEDRLAEVAEVPQAPRGKEFRFLRAQFVVFDTGARARTPVELGRQIPLLSSGSIFFHFVEARRRPPLRRDDFSVWLDGWGAEGAPTQARLAAIDFSFGGLVDLSRRIADCFRAPDPGAGR